MVKTLTSQGEKTIKENRITNSVDWGLVDVMSEMIEDVSSVSQIKILLTKKRVSGVKFISNQEQRRVLQRSYSMADALKHLKGRIGIPSKDENSKRPM